MEAKNASTCAGTLWAFNLKTHGNILKRSSTTGPNCQFMSRLVYESFPMSDFNNFVLNRAVHGHTVGARPWAWAENNLEDMMAKIVGEFGKKLQKHLKNMDRKTFSKKKITDIINL